MSSDPGGGRPPPTTKTPPSYPPFQPRKYLLRTPPPPVTYATTTTDEEEPERPGGDSPMVMASAAAQSVFESVMAALSPVKKTNQATTAGPSKRCLSPEEVTQRKLRRRGARPCLQLPELIASRSLTDQPDTPNITDYRTPCSTEEEDNGEGQTVEVNMARASSRTLLSVANKAAGKINNIVRSPASRLNKADTASVSDQLGTLLEVVSHLAVMLGEAQKAAEVQETISGTMKDAIKQRAADLATVALPLHQTQTHILPQTFAEKVKAGPVIKLVPANREDPKIKTAEDTKTLLKTSVAPAKLNIKVDAVRKLAGAGLIVQTRSRDDMEKLKSAIPPSLRATEPKGRQPLVALNNMDGKEHDLNEILKAIKDQNQEGLESWPLEKMKSSCRVAFKKSRLGGTRCTLVLACDPAFRRALVEKGKLYIGWEVITASDFTKAICCTRCQHYGHGPASCKADHPTCSRCGTTGHKAEDCKETIVRCATCHKFGHKKASLEHRTASQECPARVHAERRMMESTQY